MTDTILVPLDGSTLAEQALPYATMMASATDARLLLTRVLSLRPPGSAIDEQAALEGALEETAASIRTPDLIVHTVVERGSVGGGARAPSAAQVASLLAAVGAREGASTIVMSTHGRSGLGRWIYGSVADSVLRQTTIPVMLIPPNARGIRPPAPRRRLLVPLDGSEMAEESLAAAEPLARQMQAELVLLQVIPTPTYPIYGDGYAFVPFDEERALTDARGYLQEHLARLHGEGHRASMEVLFGEPSVMVAEVARTLDIDLIVMGTHGRSGLARLILGSVATGTLQRADVPVLLVRPAALAADAAAVPAGASASAPPAPATPAGNDSIDLHVTPDDLALIERSLKSMASSQTQDAKISPRLRALVDRIEAAHRAAGEPLASR